ncbi:hypothetical protein EYZ11_002195 [Aspergillus tanneri]|uniref:Uncharacterized protein n=1 Tax=Aspergillus tanneri TaxID=1220188 RepID=A0A4V3UQB0_9EURO|nr:hypothetical protein EYZ11_002195 [Aspergillus tanneri]
MAESFITPRRKHGKYDIVFVLEEAPIVLFTLELSMEYAPGDILEAVLPGAQYKPLISCLRNNHSSELGICKILQNVGMYGMEASFVELKQSFHNREFDSSRSLMLVMECREGPKVAGGHNVTKS